MAKEISSNARKKARKKAQQEARKEQKALKKRANGSDSTTTTTDSIKRPTKTMNNTTGSNHQQAKKKAKHGHPNKSNHRNSNASSKSHSKDTEEEEDDDDDDDDLLAFAAAWADGGNSATKSKGNSSSKEPASTKNHKKKQNKVPHNYDRKPPQFPKNLPVPDHDFLRDNEHYGDSYAAATETAYEGLAWSGPTKSREVRTRHALTVLDDHGLFRTDVTQPAGLGAKLVMSYVTRCLLGDEGTTYRYLGLRMFAHSWNGLHTSDEISNNSSLSTALQSIQTLNANLSEQTKTHLETLGDQRKQRSDEEEPYLQGQSTFNVTLINKMTTHKRLREEPMFGTSKYSVGWHADSSLEHFSAIAVYHTLMEQEAEFESASHKSKRPTKRASTNNHTDDDEWAVALRVAHDAEGPRAKRLGDITVEPSAPPLAVSLPSGSTYFMLDDFNHHHQHAVLAPTHTTSSTTIRYSSTHRLLRQGHTVQDILARCHKTIGGSSDDLSGIHHGPKRWRSEQVLLTELENEWLRQFFVQGVDHKELLWGYWKEPIQELFRYWEQLERRTLQVITLMQRASEERCKEKDSSTTNNNKSGREALRVLAQVQGDRPNAAEAVYDPMANLLLDRAKSRDLWARREQDSIFQRLPEGCQPIPFPVAYGGSREEAMAVSSMPDGSCRYLTDLASNVKAWGLAYENRKAV